MKILFVILVLSLSLFNTGFADDSAEEIFREAKEYTAAQEWQNAIELFQELIDQYPRSKYHDDALFWIAYCLENQPQFRLDAYMAFSKLIKHFPNSTWNDDAVIHQLDLAKIFVLQGNNAYMPFIREQAKNELPYIAQKSSDILKELELVAADSGAAPATATDQQALAMEALYDKLGLTKDAAERAELEEDSFLFFPTERYINYRSLLRNDDNWSKQELFDFGMWIILKDEQMSDYFALNGFDRKEWFRKYWAMKDPTPTTSENEALAEFERRVLHAKSYYGTLIDYKHIKYLRDQELRRDWFHAPWDARGELYVKYGEPDFATINDFREDEWMYNNLHADFIIKHHMTNIYGNAIRPGSYSEHTYRDNLPRLNFEYIFNNEFRYTHDYDKEPIEDAQVDIRVNPHNRSEIIIVYALPWDELEANDDDIVNYRQTYVIYNEDLKPIEQMSSNEFAREPASENIERQIKILLPPGQYMMALRLEDLNSDKLGIYVDTFTVKNKDIP